MIVAMTVGTATDNGSQIHESHCVGVEFDTIPMIWNHLCKGKTLTFNVTPWRTFVVTYSELVQVATYRLMCLHSGNKLLENSGTLEKMGPSSIAYEPTQQPAILKELLADIYRAAKHYDKQMAGAAFLIRVDEESAPLRVDAKTMEHIIANDGAVKLAIVPFEYVGGPMESAWVGEIRNVDGLHYVGKLHNDLKNAGGMGMPHGSEITFSMAHVMDTEK